MNERRARERSGHPQLGVQRRAARRVRRCGGRRRGASAGETVVVAWWGLGTGEDRVRCRGASREVSWIWFEPTWQRPATASWRRSGDAFQLPVQRRNIREKDPRFTLGLAGLDCVLVGGSGLFAGLAQGFIWALGTGSGLDSGAG